MNKVLVFSDIHIASHKNSTERLNDCIKCLEWVFLTAESRGIDTLVFSGDMFHDRCKIHVIAYQKTFEVFEKYKHINCFLLLGNHDLFLSELKDISSVFPLRALPKITIVDRPCTINIKNKNIDFLPYTKNPLSDIDLHFKNKSDVLFTHVAVNGAYLNTYFGTTAEVSIEYDGDMQKVDAESFSGWKKILSGHYHAAQRLSANFEYIGSPLELSFNEVFQKKHIIEMNLDDLQCSYIENTFSPKHLIIHEKEISKYNVNNNFIRIITDNLNSSTVLDIRNSLKDKASTIEFKEQKKNKTAELKTDIDKAKKILSEGEIIEKYTSLVETKLNKDKLISIGRDIIKKATVN